MRMIEDCINDLACDIENFIGGNITERQNELMQEILEIHKAEKRPKGRWILEREFDGKVADYYCSCCEYDTTCHKGLMEIGYYKYCTNCGADMRESEEK